MSQFTTQLFVTVLIFSHPSHSVPITISAVMSPPLPAFSGIKTDEVSVVPVDKANLVSASTANSPQVMSTGGEVSRLYSAAVGVLTSGAALSPDGVFSVAGVVQLLASLLAGLSSLAAELFGRSPDGAMVVPLIGRALTRSDLDLVETLLVDVIDVYEAWSRSEQWRGAVVSQ